MAFTPEPLVPQQARVVSLIEGNYNGYEQPYVHRVQYQPQPPASLPIIVNRDYVPIIAIVGIVGLIALVALLAFLKR
jgi:hypothetical protein